MGVVYKSNNGIWYKVTESCDIADSELEYGLEHYIDENISDDFDYFVVGFAGNDSVYIVLKNAFENGLDLTAKKEELDKELTRLKLVAVGDFGSVGGLYVY